MNQFEQTFYQALMRVCIENYKRGMPYVAELRSLMVQTEKHQPKVAEAVRDHAVYAEWQQVYNDPESTRNLNKLTENVFEVLMKLLGYGEYVIAGYRNWNIRVTYKGVDGMEWATVTLENLVTGKTRKCEEGKMSAILALSHAFTYQAYLAGDFTYWTGEDLNASY